MKKYYYLILVTFIIACSTNTDNSFKIPREIIISGRIYNADSQKKEILFFVGRPGRSSKTVRAKLDSLGNFSASFESYTPTDILVEYKAEFYILIHPGDSLFIIFNGNLDNTPELLKSIKYSGVLNEKLERIGEEKLLVRTVELSSGLHSWAQVNKGKAIV